MLKPTHLRDLLLDPASHPRGQPHLSAASGLVCKHERLYCIADDEHHIAEFAVATPEAPIQMHRLLPGDLPADKSDRKKRKPDFESLVALSDELLLALGSGSRPQREQGVAIHLSSEGKVIRHHFIDLSPLFAPLHLQFDDLNIEGAFVADGQLHLLQRGNKGSGVNARISFTFPSFMAWAHDPQAPCPAADSISTYELGTADGIPYGFTDGAAWHEGTWVFSAVAENTQDSYADGNCAGCAIGCIDSQGRLLWMEPVQDSPKAEGIAFDKSGRLLMVTDADDPLLAATLLAVSLRGFRDE